MDNKIRCNWAGTKHENMIKYHDTEWGVPVHDDQKIFEFFILDAFQAGLSWQTIINKRENFRKAFDNFDYIKISQYSDDKLEELKQDAGIIRNRLKIEAARNNARAFIKVQEEYGTFDKYIWSFTNNKTIKNAFKNMSEVPASTPLSDKISKDLKIKGFKFVGTTIVYSILQAMGIVNDHTVDCFRYNEV